MMEAALKPSEQLERVLSANLGIERRSLTAFRKEHLTKPAHWRYEREVIITADGLRKIAEHFDVVLPDSETMEGTVERWQFKNTKIIILEDGAHVRVRDNTKFRKGMKVKYRNEGGTFVLMGRAPRFPGRW
jgi:hypothetical protein